MSGLLRRLTRRRPATADETGTTTPASSEPAGAPAETPAEPGGGHSLGWAGAPSGDQPAADVTGEAPTPGREPTLGERPEGDEQATQVLPATGEQMHQPTAVDAGPAAPVVEPPPARDLPAGIDPSELAGAPVPSARRGRLRRRLRYLRAVRELLLRDLGGFTYEIHRTAGGTPTDVHRRLLESKTNRIAALDTEVRDLEGRLGEPHAGTLMREPGIGGTCPECGELHASDAHYCARCGAPLDARARARRDAAVAAAVQQTTGSHPAQEPAAASVLWAAGPRPERAPQAEPEEEPHPSPVTSQWLALSQHGPKDDAVAAADAPTAGGDEATAPPAATGGPPRPAGGDESTAPDTVMSADEPAPPAVPDPTAADTAAGAETAGATAGEPETRETAEVGDEEPARTGSAAVDASVPAEARAETPAGDPAEMHAEPPAEGPTEMHAEPPAEGPTEMQAEPPAEGPAETPGADATDTAGADGADTPVPDAADNASADAAEAPASEAVENKPATRRKRARTKKPAADSPEFAPAPNGKRDEDVSPPLAPGDPLTSPREQGS